MPEIATKAPTTMGETLKQYRFRLRLAAHRALYRMRPLRRLLDRNHASRIFDRWEARQLRNFKRRYRKLHGAEPSTISILMRCEDEARWAENWFRRDKAQCRKWIRELQEGRMPEDLP